MATQEEAKKKVTKISALDFYKSIQGLIINGDITGARAVTGGYGADAKEDDSEEEEKGEKEYTVTNVVWDCEKGEGRAVQKLTFEVCEKTWVALDEDDLCEKISAATGWLIEGLSCEVVGGAGKGEGEQYVVRGLCGGVGKFEETFEDINKARACYEFIKKEGRYSSIELDDVSNENEPEMIEHEQFSYSEEDEAGEEAGVGGE